MASSISVGSAAGGACCALASCSAGGGTAMPPSGPVTAATASGASLGRRSPVGLSSKSAANLRLAKLFGRPLKSSRGAVLAGARRARERTAERRPGRSGVPTAAAAACGAAPGRCSKASARRLAGSAANLVWGGGRRNEQNSNDGQNKCK